MSVLLARLFEWTIGGKGLGLIVAPFTILAALWGGGQLLEARRDTLRREGAQACMDKVRLAQIEANARQAIAEAKAKSEELAASAAALQEVRSNAQQIELEFGAYRAAAEASAHQPEPDRSQCLSDGVRKLATGVR